ncbi:unnamed protein product, partial [Aphanomyces euteiches]
ASVRAKLLSSLYATVVQATCGVVASFARQLGAAFAPFADALVVPLLNAACVRRMSAEDPADRRGVLGRQSTNPMQST